jgi:CheY-like chemotaxis protein
MDINLPGMYGFEALKYIKIDSGLEPIPIFALTLNSLEARFNDYITKPL